VQLHQLGVVVYGLVQLLTDLLELYASVASQILVHAFELVRSGPLLLLVHL
jgi:hypothetical protein